MMTVKVYEASYSDGFTPSSHYSLDGDGIAGECFFTSGRGEWFGSDWLIVPENPYSCFCTDIPKERRILFALEPPEIRSLPSYYLEQFGHVVNISAIPGYSGHVVITSPKLGWTAGLSDELSTFRKAMNYPVPQKTRTLSIITSLKHKTEYHRKRADFMRSLQAEFAGVIDCYGRDFNPVSDKLDAIAPYKYHVAIENSRHANYWTEKLTDAWAGWSLPIYCGDPEILNHVPDKRGIEVIDIDDREGATARIREIVDGDVYSSRLEAISRCREWALRESNMYESAREIIASHHGRALRLERPELFRRMISPRKNLVYSGLKAVSQNFADKIFVSYHRMKGRFWE